MNPRDWLRLVVAVAVCEGAGVVGSQFTFEAIPTWYATLEKPFLSPPNWVFGPVWITLYILMGVALYLVWRQGMHTKGVKKAFGMFGIQLVLNSLWSVVFFGLHNPLYALGVLIIMWASILATIILFRRVSPTAAYLLIPYFLWVTFAGYLNYSVWSLNY